MESYGAQVIGIDVDATAPRQAGRLGPPSRTHRRLPRLVLSPLLHALQASGTRHIYGDTTDVDELWRVAATTAGAVLAEIDGNTVNQPLVRRVLDRYLAREATARREFPRGEDTKLARVGVAITRPCVCARASPRAQPSRPGRAAW
ncbi:MAG: hypothetical protein C5B48_00585 [Candidatus Rokuibacteriota bacterium]|nr:MAG: hypothetical protein C5B48_00585 [Candidatus Rokubacteria bacterium]